MIDEIKIIAGTYKIEKEIGSGGGGVVYLAEHTRLLKKVVLKADKRSLKAKITTLRREVDSLKDLNNQYIPKVYDFVIEDDVVYTVMDYIAGRSLDFYINENIKFPQADIIKWTKQLLEALNYLHTRPPHGILHADIKPANIMLNSENEAILIDFNIALALGEDGAVAVGKSYGYASPEHYGIDYTNVSKADYLNSKSINSQNTYNATKSQISASSRNIDNIEDNVTTEIIEDNINTEKTEVLETEILTDYVVNKTASLIDNEKTELLSNYYTSNNNTINLDVRSDIYSLGATIYHILTGKKPAIDAYEVEIIDNKELSKAFIDIISKAMNPDPLLRYQTAEEMLVAIENIHKTDKRSIRLKRSLIGNLSIVMVLLVCGISTTFVGLKQKENLQKSLTLAESSSNALLVGDKENALKFALESLDVGDGVFKPKMPFQTEKALADALGVYELSDGYKLKNSLVLPSAPLYIEISKDGNKAIIQYSKEIIIVDVETRETLYTLDTGESALYEVRFLNSETLVYTGDEGIVAFDLNTGKKLWSGELGTNLAISGDGEIIATIYKENDYADIYEAATGEKIKSISFEGRTKITATNDTFINPNDDIFELNYDGSKLGVSFGNGALWVYDLINRENDIELFDETSGYNIFDGGFSNQYFAFSSTNADESLFVVIDTELFEQTGGFNSENKYTVCADENGIYVQTENVLVKIDPITGEQIPLVNTDTNFSEFAISDEVIMISTDKEYILFDNDAIEISRIEKESGTSFFDIQNDIAVIGNFNENSVEVLEYNSFDDRNLFEYNIDILHDEARISNKYNTLMLFRYDEFTILDENKNIVNKTVIPKAEDVYDQQFRRTDEFDYLEIIYYDGTLVKYSAKDGLLMGEEKIENPDKSIVDVFNTSMYYIESPLHGNPVVYSNNDKKVVKELVNEGYLTYVTEVGDKIVLQYITTDNFFYGLLLNEQLEVVAYMPYLCDVVDGELIFDVPTGKVRKSQIYQIDELVQMAQK